MKVHVQGLWHLGLVTSACLAELGHDVIAFDYDTDLISDLNNLKLPVQEPGLNDLVSSALSNQNLSFSSSLDTSSDPGYVIWIAYDTPVDHNDVANCQFVLDNICRTIDDLDSDCLFIVSSQLPVGSISFLESYVLEQVIPYRVSFACIPENLRLGKALHTFLHPDRIVVGFRNSEDKAILSKLLSPIDTDIIFMSVESAEMVKHSINGFLALSIAYGNEIATLSQKVGASPEEVSLGMMSDHRIGHKAYLKPGSAFAGGTLARDIGFMTNLSSNNDLDSHLIRNVSTSNNSHKLWALNILKDKFGSLCDLNVTIWGLTYKVDTDTLRGSLSVLICNELLASGSNVTVHDPVVSALPIEWQDRVIRLPSHLDTLDNSDALIVMTPWVIYAETNFNLLDLHDKFIVIDPCGCLSPDNLGSISKYSIAGRGIV